MIKTDLGEWPKEWAVLFVVRANAGYIPGKVRLMKYVSVLQRDGFPIVNRFINAEMGPYDEDVHSAALSLRDYGFLEVEKVDSGKEKRRIDYRITDLGVEAFNRLILSLLEQLPHQSPFRRQFKITRTQFRFKKTENIIDKIHGELYLDDAQEFQQALRSSLTQTQKLMASLEGRYVDSCPLCLHLLGSLEFSRDSLKEILQTRVSDPYSGKNHVLYNLEQLLLAVRKLESHAHVEDPRLPADTPLSHALEELKYRLHCAELNCDVYGILRPIEVKGDEFEALALI